MLVFRFGSKHFWRKYVGDVFLYSNIPVDIKTLKGVDLKET